MSKFFLNTNKKEEKVLRNKIPPLDFSRENKKELRQLIKKMRQVMKAAPGIGLAANQIGIAKRIFVAQVPKSRESTSDQKFYAVINPKIIKTSSQKTKIEEACLSVPESYGFVERAEKVVLEGFNVDGKKIKIKAWGLLARVFQHEVDHLDGKLFIDRTKEVYPVRNLARAGASEGTSGRAISNGVYGAEKSNDLNQKS